jgi:hypothetical protein
MKPFISTAVYGVLNYIIALTLIASPWLFDLRSISSAAFFLPIYIGWLQLIMAIFTNNETGFIKQFPVRIHYTLDVVMGFILIVSPFVYGFAFDSVRATGVFKGVFLPEVLLGGLLFIMGLFTKKSPFTTKLPKTHAEGLISSTDSI